MSIQELRKYGPLCTTFKGKGIAKLSDDQEQIARFTLGQRPDATLLFCIDVAVDGAGFLVPTLNVTELVGELKDGRPVRAEGFFVLQVKGALSPTTRLLGYAGSLTIGDVAQVDQASISFDIANFRFTGTEIEEIESQGLKRIGRSLVSLDLGKRSVKIRQVDNYTQVEASLRSQRGVEITCTATTHVNNGQEIELAIDHIDRLCDLMSIARGTLVSWTAMRTTSHEAEKSPYELYRNSITSRFAGTDVIPHQDGQSTKLFLERGFRRAAELETDFDVRKIARAYCETRDGPFLQTKALAIGVLAEHVANVRARLDGRTYLMDDDVFQGGWQDLRNEVEQAISACYPQLNKKRVKAMSASVRNINRRPLSWRLRELATWLDLEHDSNDLAHFENMRNSLAHDGEFPDSENAVGDYRRVQRFLDRLILRLFDYHGPYNDFESVRRAEI